MSSLWGSRFQTTKTTRQTRDRRLSNDKDLGDVFASAYESLPQIDSHCLTSDKLLGLGSMFHVNREIYCEQRESPSKFYVAVKYVRMEQPPETHHQIVIALLRELKVITHPVLRSHPHIMSAFGYGWTGFNSKESRPFIVMPYADFGTLSEALQATQQHRQVSILERYELALNVASGLHALHEHGIVHGDVKSNNVLVCTRSEPLGHATVDYGPPWVAKLADFGSSMSLKEADEQSFGYTGTPLYNAPEIEDYHSEGSHNGSFEAYKKADVYSFGLLLWEVMKVGCFYLETYRDNDISYRKKRYREYLQKVHHRPGDALLEIALRSLEDMKDEIADFQYWDATTGALTACLRKNASLRASSMAVLENLRDSVRNDRPLVVYSLPRLTSGPVDKPVMVGSMPENRENPKMNPGLIQLKPSVRIEERWNGLVFRRSIGNISSKGLELIPFRSLDTRSLERPAFNQHDSISLQRAVMSPLPPRKIQERLVERWELQATENNDIAAVSKACFELSICYYLGFGVEQDYVVSHKFLQQACYGSSIAKAILGRVTPVFKMLKSGEGVPRSHFGKGSSTYFADRVRSVRSEIILRRDLTETPRLSLRVSHNSDTWRVQLITQLIEQELMRSADVAEAMDIDRLDELWEECAREQSLPLESLSQAAISAALTEACRLGSFKVAKSLATLCLQYIGRYGEPNPLHWLMMFPPEEAQFMAKLLVLGPKDKSSFPGGICFRCLNARTSSVVFLPEHCMELVGAPLHWAVRSRNLEIVETLLDLGADLTLRCKLRAQLPGEPPNIARVTYNPLDIALEYHLYDIVNVLLIRGQGQKLGKSMEVGASLVAHTATPFSRLVIHGSSYRFALQKTVQTLSDMGWPLDRPDFFGEIPLIASLTNTAQEEYIIQELLRTCPQVVERGLPKGDNLAISVVLSAETDHPSTAWKLQQVVHQVQDLNACNDAGFNALHYCALIGNAPMTEVLLSTSRVDINAESRNQYRSTPLLQAAQFGRTGVLTILLEAGVDPNSSNEMGDTALELSVLNRQYDTASMLIERGACLDFGVHNSVPRSTVLHAACIQCSNRPPLVRQLLMGHAKLRDRNVLHRVTRGPVGGAQTPLHGAVLLGDLDSVKALLEFGADPSFWICPPGLEASDKFSMTLYKMTPLDLVNFTLQRAASKGLPSEQLKVARQGRSDLMRHILMNENFDKRQERLEWEHFDGAPQFNFRLEDLQLAKQGQAGERDFLARLEEMKRLMEEKLKCKQP